MQSFLNSFNNSWSYVQIAILLAIILIVLGLAWLAYRLLSTLSRRWIAYLADHKGLPSDTLIAVQKRGDTLTLTVHKDAVVEANRLADILQAQGIAHPMRAHEIPDKGADS